MFSRSKVELGWPPYISTIYPYTCTSWFDCMTQLSLDPLFDFTIYVLQVCPSFLPTYELHISLSGRKRKRHNTFIALVRIHKYHIYWETWECHIMESLSFILKIYTNSGMMVEQRIWDKLLDLIVLSFNCSRPKWGLRSPMVEGNMGKFESHISLF